MYKTSELNILKFSEKGLKYCICGEDLTIQSKKVIHNKS
jgi:hypothetical protein